MHKSSILRMQWFVNEYLRKHADNPIKILDVGSYDVNGSYKSLFTDARFEYIGLDMDSGPNVDIVAKNPYHWQMFEDETFDAVISGQTFEHVEFFWITMQEMVRVLKRNGVLCIIAPREQPLHRYPIDTYRFDADGLVALAKYTNITPLHASVNLAPPNAPLSFYSSHIGDSMLVAQKPNDWKGFLDCSSYVFAENDLASLTSGFISYDHRMWLESIIFHFPTDGKKIMIFGSGVYGQMVKNWACSKGLEIECFVDNNKKKQGNSKDGIRIISAEESLHIANVVYIIAILSEDIQKDIIKQLTEMGVAVENIAHTCMLGLNN